MLIRDWRQVLKRAWSVRLILAAGLLSGAEVALPLLPLPLPAGIFAALSALPTAAAFVARLLAPKDITDSLSLIPI